MTNQRVEPGYWYPARVDAVTRGVNGTGEYFCIRFEVLIDLPNKKVPGFFYCGSEQWDWVCKKLQGSVVCDESLNLLEGRPCWVFVRADLRQPRRRSQVVWVEAADFDATSIPCKRISPVEASERFGYADRPTQAGNSEKRTEVATVTDVIEEGDRLDLVFDNGARWSVQRRGAGWKALGVVFKNLMGSTAKKGDLKNPGMMVGHGARITVQGNRAIRVDPL